MIRKENHYLFYICSLLFLGLTYLGREIISPAEHYFILLYQIPCLILLPFIYRQLLPLSRFLAGILFFLFFVLMWDTFNHVPFIGFYITALLYTKLNIDIGLEWTSYILKPACILIFLYINKHSFLTFFNTLISTKEYQIDPELKKIDIKDKNIDDLNPSYVSKTSYFYFNPLTQMLTIVFNGDKNKSIYKTITLINNEFRYFFFNYKKFNVQTKFVKLVDNLLYIQVKNELFVFDWSSFTPTLKSIISDVLYNENELHTSIITASDNSSASTISNVSNVSENSDVENNIAVSKTLESEEKKPIKPISILINK